MPRTIPWKNIEELAAILQWERDALDRQIAALLQRRDLNDQTARLEILLCKYLVLGSARKAVDWSIDMGWRRDSINHGQPSTRNWHPDDLYEVFHAEPVEQDAPLVALCRRVFFQHLE
jgi:hypothetical protein